MHGPAVYELPVAVGAADIDANGHMNNAVYFRHLQDAAVAHWYAVFPEERTTPTTAWVIRRHEIDYRRPALEGDRLLVRTWLGEASAATWERFTRVVRQADGQVIAEARTIYVLIDPASGRPRRIGPELKARFPATPPESSR
jgi:acyl-CoA thioester hydrolase